MNEATSSKVSSNFIIRNRDSGEWETLGGKDFVVLPRVGEHVEIGRDSLGMMTRVVMILHPDEPTGVVDIYAVEVGTSVDYLKKLESSNHPVSLTMTERLMLANQYRILSKLYPDEAKDYAERSEILEQGFSIFYRTDQIDPNEVSEDACREVLDIMNMYSTLRFSYKKLDDKSGIDKYDICFDGFSGNDEGSLMVFVRFLVDQQHKFQVLKEDTRDDFNSHMPRLDHYRRMLVEWNRSKNKHELTKDDIIRIVGV